MFQGCWTLSQTRWTLLSWDGGSRWWRWFRQKSEDRMLESLGSVCRLEMMEVVQAEVWEPVVVISDWVEIPEMVEFDVELLVTENSVVVWGLWSQLKSPGGLLGLTAWILFNQPRFLHLSCTRARSCARGLWPYSPCYSLLLEYKYRMIHGLCQEKIQCLLLGGFSVL